MSGMMRVWFLTVSYISGNQLQLTDGSVWFSNFPSHLLNILDGARNIKSTGVQSAFSTRLEYQRPRRSDLSQQLSQEVSELTDPFQSLPPSSEMQQESKSIIEEQIRLLCQQHRAIHKRHSNNK